MGWISGAMAALGGVLAALAVALVAKRTRSQSVYAAVWVLVAGLLFGMSELFVTPALQARYDAGTVDDLLSGNAAFAAVKKHDPQTYARIMGELREGLLNGRSKSELIDVVRREMITLVQQRLPRASDEAATEYMRVMVQEMGELRQQSGGLCHRFLFARGERGIDLTRYVSANTLAADSAALSQVVRSSVVSPQPVPTQADVAARMQPVLSALAGRYGADLALLKSPLAPGADPDKLCSISIDMYTVILQMPPADSGKLIRYLMGQG